MLMKHSPNSTPARLVACALSTLVITYKPIQPLAKRAILIRQRRPPRHPRIEAGGRTSPLFAPWLFPVGGFAEVAGLARADGLAVWREPPTWRGRRNRCAAAPRRVLRT